MTIDVEFKFEVQGSEHEFRVESFQVNEELSKDFQVSLSLLSLDADITFEELIRKPALLTLFGQGVGSAVFSTVWSMRFDSLAQAEDSLVTRLFWYHKAGS